MCTGVGSYGRLGNGLLNSDSTATPAAVTTPANVTAGWDSVSAGGAHTCAIASGSKNAYCFGRCRRERPSKACKQERQGWTGLQAWQLAPLQHMRAGAGLYGQLGTNGTADAAIPKAIIVPQNVTDGWSVITAGAFHTCTIAAVSKAAYCYGTCRWERFYRRAAAATEGAVREGSACAHLLPHQRGAHPALTSAPRPARRERCLWPVGEWQYQIYHRRPDACVYSRKCHLGLGRRIGRWHPHLRPCV